MSLIQMVIEGREKELGGFTVRRILPYGTHRMVGPFIFFDHMGPAVFAPDTGVSVRPHPHIHLATVTYLFEGTIHHRDSLGYDQIISPGAVNWMTAGRGIVHSERTPEYVLENEHPLNGIQCWIALPDEHQDIDPSFTHHPSESLPLFEVNGVRLKLLLGSAFGKTSPVAVHSNLFYLESKLSKGDHLSFPTEGRESAIYVVEGRVRIDGRDIPPYSMAVAQTVDRYTIEALEDSRVMILGGAPVGKRYIYWNFVSSSEDNIEVAKQDWMMGPGESGSRFPYVPGDSDEYIPLPGEMQQSPKGTIM